MPAWDEAVWFSLLTDAALKSAAIWGVAWMVAKLLSGRSAAWRHAVWMAAAAATLAVPFLAAGLPVLRVPVSMPELTFGATATNAGVPAMAAGVPPPSIAALPAPARSWHPDWRLGLMLLWAAGAALGIAQMLVAAAALARARRRARPYPQADVVAELAEALAFDEPVQVLESAAGTMPMTFGVLRPVVFLPADAADWPEERRRMVLLHELGHVKRGDAATHLLARTALCLYWWNPLAWMGWREFIKERERASDDLVLAAGARASDYAGHLLEVARTLRPAPSVAWAAVSMARRSHLEGRLIAILNSEVNRKSLGQLSAVAVALVAILAVAPFAAMRAQQQGSVQGSPSAGQGVRFRAVGDAADPAQNQGSGSLPADVDATIRAALAQKNHEMLEQAASGFARLKDYGTARKLLETALSIRQETSGTGSVEYGMGLVKLGDLARQQREAAEATSLYTKAAAVLNGKPEAALPLFFLGLIRYSQKDYPEALGYFQKMPEADPSQAGQAFTWMALAHQGAGDTAAAESSYRQAIAAERSATVGAAAAMYLFSQFLETENRHDEAAAQLDERDALLISLATAARAKAQKAGSRANRVGNGVTPPVLLSKQEPEYSDEAKAAKYQGTTILYVEIGTDGIAHNLQVVRGLDMGLDEKAIEAVGNWRFKPGTKDGVPVTVAATIEVNFRLL